MILLDRQQIALTLALVLAPGQLTEIRVLDGVDRPGGRAMNRTGYFDSVDAIVAEIGKLSGWHGVYFVPQPVDPLLANRVYNRLIVAQRGAATLDTNVTARRVLLADFDPATPIKGIAATDAEKAAAVDRARKVAAAMTERFAWPAPILADSGNGAHLIYTVALAADDTRPKRWLEALALQYGGDGVIVDTSIFNPARIWKLYGTLACKGANLPDRPWRMASVLSVPAPPEILTADAIDAALAGLGDAGAAAAPALPSSTPAGRPGPAPSSPAGDFDAAALLTAAGFDLDDGHAAGPVTIRPFKTCPCGRRETDGAAFLSIGESGAVGVGCLHATCDFSKTKATPGDHWKRLRAEIDPSYGPNAAPAGPTSAERVDAARAFADRMAAPRAPGPAAAAPVVDVEGFLGAPRAPARRAIEAPPAPAAVVDGSRGRRRINVVADAAELRDHVLAALVNDAAIFAAAGQLVRVDGDSKLAPLEGGALDSATVDACEFVTYRRDRDTDRFIAQPDTLPVRILKMIENLNQTQVAGFRTVDQIVRSPIVTPAGEIVTAPGYCQAARVIIADCPTIDPLDGQTAADALAWIQDIVSDFPFEGGMGNAEAANFIGSMLVPLLRPMIRGPVPLLLIEANRPGVGKSLLAQLIQVVYGLPAEVGPMATKEEAFASQLLSILIDARAVHVFDNVKHAVLSASLDMVLTSESYTDRILGKSKTLHCVVRQLWIMTSNNAKLSQDMVRRSIRSRLRFDGERPEERIDVKRPDLLAWASANRGAILSRLVLIARDWLDAGRPVYAVPRMGSFESFSEIVGSIMAHAGASAWLGNLSSAKAAMAIDDEWLPFLRAWFNSAFHKLNAKGLIDICEREGVLSALLGDGSPSSRASRLSGALRARRDQVIHGYRVAVDVDESTGHKFFTIELARDEWAARMAGHAVG